MKKTMINAALALTFGVAAVSAQAAALNNGDVLTINTATHASCGSSCTATYWSWFGMDMDGNSKIAQGEKVSLAQGTQGIVIGSTQAPGAYHSGAPLAGDTGPMLKSWFFNSSTGTNHTTVGITGNTVTGLDMSGWYVDWAGVANIPMTGGAWQIQNGVAAGDSAVGGNNIAGSGYTNGKAQFTWNGVYGSAYQLDYAATVPMGDASGFGGTQYFLHLTGTVQAAPAATVPVPAAAWLLGSGLVGLVGVARRRRAA